MNRNRASGSFVAAIWTIVAELPEPATAMEIRQIEAVDQLCREHKAALDGALARMATARQVVLCKATRKYRVTGSCVPPPGCELPIGLQDSEPFGLATERMVAAGTMPVDRSPPPRRAPLVGRFDADAHPSRQGNRLVYRDGRVTDLVGNALHGVGNE